MSTLSAFTVPARLEAHEPPEARGLARDEVRLLVATRDGHIEHTRFRQLPDQLAPGDLLVINTSRTIPAALPAATPDGVRLELHLSTPIGDERGDRWVVELRHERRRYRSGAAGTVVALPAGAEAELLVPYVPGRRLWVARLRLPERPLTYLARHGRPVRYAHVPLEWPLSAYQTVYASEDGSAEMPSAGRPFTPELITALAARGVATAPVLLHTGVSSLEQGERPYPERFRVPGSTARLVTATRAWGGRVVAVGTSVVRALETQARPDGAIDPGAGLTDLVITPERGVRAVDGLITGWHEPDSSHLSLLEAVAGRERVQRSYASALEHGYLWHEFGDSLLIL
ncbi:MAG: putative S-adenosylmethionine:tRNA ribosyltransferase-isomerase [Solirubrobacterales bacterium]|nr:putative S-adenosylmethionine:tRNA ribosyltransferase-isomerase [Solirubrobacterales bacterium]